MLSHMDGPAVWLVVRVRESEIVDLGGKVKFPRGVVVFSGSRDEAIDYLLKNGAAGCAVMYAKATAGNGGTATAGYKGTATAGDYGTATAGNGGTATAGYKGTATAGDHGTATAGNGGTATAGDHGTVAAGEGGILQIHFRDGGRRRIRTVYVGENNVKPNTKYRLSYKGDFIPV